MRKFQELSIWQKSHSLCLEIYMITSKFPKDELYGLTSQMRRSASSIPTNVAEGCGRSTDADFKRFLTMAAGSSSELEYQLILAKDLRFLNDEQFISLSKNVIEIRKMIYSFSSKLSPRT